MKQPTKGTVVITGARCADAMVMRFWYGNKPPLPDKITSRTGDESYAISGTAGADMPGYMLWPRPGSWKLIVWRNGRIVGSLVFCVAKTRYAPAPCD